ncbi:MAG: hypothetical protein IH874_03830 [Candidatus Dadabacteria bacterium]|nr:hypothetical protein [Candidatus Dadabacteria bacterium]
MGREELELAAKMWNEIREVLTLCGDIGQFRAEDFVTEDMPRVVWDGKPVLPISLLTRLIELGGGISEVFWNAYEALCIAAANRLGLENKLSVAFADSLTCLRTGWVGGNGTEAEQCIAQDIFLSELSYGEGWDPKSELIQRQVQVMLMKFKTWQGSPEAYRADVAAFWRDR